jgi:hypothetical protein
MRNKNMNFNELNKFTKLAKDIFTKCSMCKFQAEHFTCGASICTIGNSEIVCAACGFSKYQGIRDDWTEECAKDLKECEKFEKR